MMHDDDDRIKASHSIMHEIIVNNHKAVTIRYFYDYYQASKIIH